MWLWSRYFIRFVALLLVNSILNELKLFVEKANPFKNSKFQNGVWTRIIEFILEINISSGIVHNVRIVAVFFLLVIGRKRDVSIQHTLTHNSDAFGPSFQFMIFHYHRFIGLPTTTAYTFKHWTLRLYETIPLCFCSFFINTPLINVKIWSDFSYVTRRLILFYAFEMIWESGRYQYRSTDIV